MNDTVPSMAYSGAMYPLVAYSKHENTHTVRIYIYTGQRMQ
jgi:hypothetical protein